ncbi:MAG: rhamnogalacturonan acetylesterase [Pyrinomonadaceae bacterium]|nr:rhamnogalacturonan acetylesterase [Acidobacteriota bacterium]MBK7932482.1 rhamnogalacturonan acetylesterase [Acidobacteriota bacterium]MBP7375582.1 rhamnogalacturonan acetylesterase [Pyrinomonadaceae bacterium]
MNYLLFILILSTSVLAQPRVVTVFLAGDSTCADKLPEKRPETGWGEMLGKHFKDGKVRVENRAMNGRSTKTFISEGRWQKIVNEVKKGDSVFVQFGHNDSSKDKGERYTPPDAYRANLIKFIDEVRCKDGNIVLMTPVMRRRFDKDGNLVDSHGEYPDIVRAVAEEKKVPLIDMHRKTEALIKRLGVEGSRSLFLQLKPDENANYPKGIEDNTHFNPKGADEVATLAVEGISESKLKLRKYLKK